MLGLPSGTRACLFDLDGVLTRTATLHARAWKAAFDTFLAEHARAGGTPFVPFDSHADYDTYVDGRPRADGVRTFLRSRGVRLPDGSPTDPAGMQTVHALGNLKNATLLELISSGGAQVYDGSVRYVQAVRAAGLSTAVVSSSANTEAVLRVTGLEGLFDVRVDGVVAARRGLPGKPAPDTFLAAAAELGVAPAHAAVFEDALAGVEAGRAGHFCLVVGVDRVGQRAALSAHGADLVVDDLAELLDAPGGR